jgi:hypothetical protein
MSARWPLDHLPGQHNVQPSIMPYLRTPLSWEVNGRIFVCPDFELWHSDWFFFLGFYMPFSGFGGLGVSVLASGTQVRGFKPGRSRRIFKGGKILTTPSFGRKVKPWVPCHRFAACKRSLNVPRKSAFRLNYRSTPPISSNFHHWSAERGGRRGGMSARRVGWRGGI